MHQCLKIFLNEYSLQRRTQCTVPVSELFPERNSQLKDERFLQTLTILSRRHLFFVVSCRCQATSILHETDSCQRKSTNCILNCWMFMTTIFLNYFPLLFIPQFFGQENPGFSIIPDVVVLSYTMHCFSGVYTLRHENFHSVGSELLGFRPERFTIPCDIQSEFTWYPISTKLLALTYTSGGELPLAAPGSFLLGRFWYLRRAGN